MREPWQNEDLTFWERILAARAALDRTAQEKPWTRPLADLDELAKQVNTWVTEWTGGERGTAILPVTADPGGLGEAAHQGQGPRISLAYRWALVDQNRLTLSTLDQFGLDKEYPIWLLAGPARKPVAGLGDRAALESRFLMHVADPLGVLGKELLKYPPPETGPA